MKAIIPAAQGTLELGYQGENLSRCVIFSPEGFPQDGQTDLLVQRCGDEAPYPALLQTDNGRLLWRPTATDTATAGEGQCELRCTLEGKVIKSRVWRTRVLPALGAEGEIPAAAEPWTARVLDAARQARQAVSRYARPTAEGTWLLWNGEKEAYEDSGIPCRAEGSVTEVNGKSGSTVVLCANDIPLADGTLLSDALQGKAQRCGTENALFSGAAAALFDPDTLPQQTKLPLSFSDRSGLLILTGLQGGTQLRDGQLLGLIPRCLKSTGENLLDPATGKARIPPGPGNTYRLTGSYTALSFTGEEGDSRPLQPDENGLFTLQEEGTVQAAGIDRSTCLKRAAAPEEWCGYEKSVSPLPPLPPGFGEGLFAVQTGKYPRVDEWLGSRLIRRVGKKRLGECTFTRYDAVPNAWHMTGGFEDAVMPGSNGYVISALCTCPWRAVSFNTLKGGTADKVFSFNIRSMEKGITFVDSAFEAAWQQNDPAQVKQALQNDQVVYALQQSSFETVYTSSPLLVTLPCTQGGTQVLQRAPASGSEGSAIVRFCPSQSYVPRAEFCSLLDVLGRLLNGTFRAAEEGGETRITFSPRTETTEYTQE